MHSASNSLSRSSGVAVLVVSVLAGFITSRFRKSADMSRSLQGSPAKRFKSPALVIPHPKIGSIVVEPVRDAVSVDLDRRANLRPECCSFRGSFDRLRSGDDAQPRCRLDQKPM